MWLSVSEYAATCSWDACKRMAEFMRDGKFGGNERVFIAENGSSFMGFCALMNPPAFPEAENAPLLKWLFVEEQYRGNRLSEKLIEAACEYAVSIGFHRICLTTWHSGLYEKYGFVKTGEREMRKGYFESIYIKSCDI